MSTPVMASEQDLRTLAGIVTDHRADLPEDGLPETLLSDLMDQIRCDVISFERYDSGRQASWGCSASRFDATTNSRQSSSRHLRVWTPRTSGTATGTAGPAVIPSAPATCAAL